MLTGGLPYLALGAGPPLVVLPGLGKDNVLPCGMHSRFELATLRAYADAGWTAYWVTRRPGVAAGVTMADLASDLARALRVEFGEPVDILGFSTGGSVAQQLAVDHADVVRRLVLACTP
jgi:pimeloyl-ACP methyl ester carboxylesterase